MPRQSLTQFVQRHPQLFQKVLVAVSGGPDSVALLRLLCEFGENLPGEMVVAHFDHGLRSSSRDDAVWVQQLCHNLSVRCETGTSQLGASDEATARAARYEFLTQVASEADCTCIATGHTRDDQVETVLHHIVRGTGLKGLSGMPAVRSLTASISLVRPLLSCSRTALIKYLKEIQQEYRTDPTNAEAEYTRNRLRNTVLPLFRAQFNPHVDDALLRLATHAADAQATIEQLAQRLLSERLETSTATTVSVRARGLEFEPATIVRELLRIIWRTQGWSQQKMTFERWEELTKLVIAQKGSQLSLPGPVQAVKKQGILVLSHEGQGIITK